MAVCWRAEAIKLIMVTLRVAKKDKVGCYRFGRSTMPRIKASVGGDVHVDHIKNITSPAGRFLGSRMETCYPQAKF